MVVLHDRGEIVDGTVADLVAFGLRNDVPVVRRVRRGGERVHWRHGARLAIVDNIVALYRERGAADYGDEPVSQLEHALQCAALARHAGAMPAVVAAALLHDIGHLLEPEGDRAIERDEDARHEIVAHGYLSPWFGPDVTSPIRWHVDAKRYLVVADSAYRATLSHGSLRSLAVQGGPFSEAEAREFGARPYAAEAIRVRRWDDGAKVPGTPVPPLETFRGLLVSCFAQEHA